MNGQLDGRMNRRTVRPSCEDARTHLKSSFRIEIGSFRNNFCDKEDFLKTLSFGAAAHGIRWGWMGIVKRLKLNDDQVEGDLRGGM